MDPILATIFIILPTIIDLTAQYIIHLRTTRQIRACPYCPHLIEGFEDECNETT